MTSRVAEKPKSLVVARPASQPARNNRGQFLTGSIGNPAGRPRGSRNKLGEAFIDALFRDFAEHGAEAIAEMRVTDPTGYVRTVASLLPREARAEPPDRFDAMSDEELREFIADKLTAGAPDIGEGD